MPDPVHEPPAHAAERAASPVRLWLGVVPLALFAGFHAWVCYPALYSEEAWLERAARVRLDTIGWCVALALLFVHVAFATLDLLRRLRARRQGPTPHADWLGFEACMLVLLSAFVVHHVLMLGVRAGEAGVAAAMAYDMLWATLGTPFQLCVYALGITALAFHIGLGLARAFELHLGMRNAGRYVAGAVAFALWLSFAQVLGRFSTGESLVPELVVGGPGGSDSAAP